MMVEKKTIGIGLLSALLAGLIVLGGIKLTDDNVYYCSSSKTVMQCTSLQQYYGLDNGKCINAKVGNKLCRNGWALVIDDVMLTSESNNVQQWICNAEECVPK
ncbi:MAG: hypothetical protein WC444_06815 [Candidatus Paceibacterota bacterium]